MKAKHTATFHNAESIIAYLQSIANKDHLTAAKQFGINNETAVGIFIPTLRELAKDIGKNHEVGLQLWQTNMHEARILASMIDDPAAVTARQIDEWTAGFNSWDVCDQVCGNLFNKTHLAIDKAIQFSSATEEYIKRASFVLMATYAVHNKGAADVVFSPFLHCIIREATDDRNFVEKSG